MTGLAGPLLLVGCGKMGGALLQGWLARDFRPPTPMRSSPMRPAAAIRGRHGVVALAEPKMLPTELAPRAIVFAIKPQAMAGVLPAYETVARSGAVVLSIAAGTGIARFEAAFGAATPVVRAMPNTPAAIGQGVTALVANRHVSADQKALCSALMAAVGAIHWIGDEELMHAITAMSGGGPAYVFLLIETLARAGSRAGCRRRSPGRWRARRSRAAAHSRPAPMSRSRSCAGTSPAPAAPPRQHSRC